MRWLIFSDEADAVVKQCDDLLSTVGQTVLHEHHHGKSSLEAIKESITQHKPDRIIVVANETKRSDKAQPLVTALSDHLLIPLYVGQATINTYSTIPVLLLTFTNAPAAPDSVLQLDIIQSATDELIHVYPHIINAKIFTPIVDEELNETALLTKFQSLWRDNPDGSHYVTIMSDMLPILLALAHDGKVSGQVNVCNKGTVSLHWLEQYLAKQIKRDLNGHHAALGEDLTDQLETWNKQMITPETRHLYQASFVVPNGAKSIEECLQQKSIQLDPVGPRILLVTGGCGFIGSTFINHWLKTYPDDRIINIDRLDAVSNMQNIDNASSPNYSLIVADINNKDIVLHLMRQYDITHVVHFAVQAHLDNSFGNSITFTETNVYGTHSVLEATRTYGKIQKIIHISTDEVYGETPDGSYQETNLLNPLNPYAATIAAAEFLVKSYGESFKLSYCIVRLSNVYGPRQHIEKVIPAFINNLMRGEKLKVHGDGKQTRLYIYIDDVIQAIESIFQRGKTKMVYNVGAENELSVLDIAKQILHKFDLDDRADELIVHSSGRSFTEKRYSSTSTSGAMKTLGWKAKVSFDEGLDRTIQWYKEHPDYWSK